MSDQRNVKITVEKIAEKVDEKLDEGKDEWAELAKKDPDKVRRQLRAFWGVAGVVCGFAVAFLLSLII